MIARFASGVGLLALAACGGSVAPGGPGSGASGDGVATHADGPDAADFSGRDASTLDASPADATSFAIVDGASNAGDANGSTDSAAGDAAAPATPSCDYVVDTAPVIMATYASGSMPTYTKGGTIADGTYWLTGLVIDSTAATSDWTYQETVEVFGTSWNNVDAYMGITRRATETLAVQGAAGTLMYTCDSLNDPALLQETVSFTFEVDGDTLLVADETDGYWLTYQRQ